MSKKAVIEMPLRFQQLLVSLALLFLAVPRLVAQPVVHCSVSEASSLPVYATQGSWSPDGSKLLLVDPAKNEVYIYGGAGLEYLGTMPPPAFVGKNAFYPVSVRPVGKEMLVEGYPQRLVLLGDRYQVKTALHPLDIAVTSKKSVKRNQVKSLWNWTVAGGDIVACSDIEQADGSWITGIVRFPMGDSTHFQEFAPSDFKEPGWVFCRLGFPYFASIGDNAYVLLFRGQPGIYESSPGAKELRRLNDYAPDNLQPVQLPEFSSRLQFAAATMRAVEETTMPVGIYGWDGSLYVLYRQFDYRSTRWVLHQVDPKTGKLLGQAEIHVDATHLMLIPGDKRWALVQKGPALRLGEERTEAIRVIDARAIPQPLRGELCPKSEGPSPPKE